MVLFVASALILPHTELQFRLGRVHFLSATGVFVGAPAYGNTRPGLDLPTFPVFWRLNVEAVIFYAGLHARHPHPLLVSSQWQDHSNLPKSTRTISRTQTMAPMARNSNPSPSASSSKSKKKSFSSDDGSLPSFFDVNGVVGFLVHRIEADSEGGEFRSRHRFRGCE